MQFPSPLRRISPKSFAPGLALFLVAAVVYIPAMSGDFIWDDDITITNNPLVQLPFSEGFRNIWFSRLPTDYYPVTWSTFWIEWRFFTDNPSGYHVVNILLHALSTVLLWRIFLRLPLPGGAAAAWFAALIFAAHPVAVDSVAWISQRKNTVSMVFYLASILSFLRYGDEARRRDYWISLAAFAAALLGKSSVIALPLVLVLLLWYRHGKTYLRALFGGILTAPPKKRKRGFFSHPLVHLSAFFVLAACSAYVTLWFQGKVLGYGLAAGNDPAKTIAKTIDSSLYGKTPLSERILAVGQVYWFYVAKILFPKTVAMVYANWKVLPGNALHYLPLFAMIGAIAAAFRFRKKIGRGPCAALLYIAVSLLPVLGLVRMSYQAYSWVANHLCYVAIPGAAAIVAGAIAALAARLPGGLSRVALPAVLSLLVLVFAQQSWRRAALYIHPEFLWRDNIAKVPEANAPYNELGIVLIRARRYEEAVPVLRQCIAIEPTFDKPHNNLGTALSHLGRDEEATAAFERAVRYNRHDPDAMSNLGLMYLRTGKPEKAVPLFRKAIGIRPMSPAAYHNYGLAMKELGRDEDATAAFARAVAMSPATVPFRNVLGVHLYRMKDSTGAREQLEAALRLGGISPEAAITLAWILATSPDPALRDGERALAIMSDINRGAPRKTIPIIRASAAALAENGRFDDAVELLTRALARLDRVNGTEADAAVFDGDLRRYREGLPFREGAADPSFNLSPGS